MHKNNPIKFIDEHLNLKVGSGICRDLPNAIFGFKEDFDWKNPYLAIHMVGRKHIQPGDVILFQGAISKSGEVISGHIGVIREVVNDSVIVIAQQNYTENDDTLKTKVMCNGKMTEVYLNSKVVLTTFNLYEYWGKEFSLNHIIFLRF